MSIETAPVDKPKRNYNILFGLTLLALLLLLWILLSVTTTSFATGNNMSNLLFIGPCGRCHSYPTSPKVGTRHDAHTMRIYENDARAIATSTGPNDKETATRYTPQSRRN